MSTPLLPALKTYDLAPATRRRFQLILDGLDQNGTELFLLKPYEKESLQTIIEQWLLALDQKQAFLLDILAQLNNQPTNDQVYENNRRKIASAVQQHILKHQAMPTHQQVAQLTGINRNTVARHINQQINNKHETMAQYSYAAKGLLDMILYNATKNGSISSARIYLNAINQMKGKACPPPQITIGNTTITQQMADELSEEQQQVILMALKRETKINLTRATPQPADNGTTGA